MVIVLVVCSLFCSGPGGIRQQMSLLLAQALRYTEDNSVVAVQDLVEEVRHMLPLRLQQSLSGTPCLKGLSQQICSVSFCLYDKVRGGFFW